MDDPWSGTKDSLTSAALVPIAGPGRSIEVTFLGRKERLFDKPWK